MNTIERMTRNTVEQELSGLGYNIAKALRSEFRDAAEDYSDLPAEKQVEIYKAILDDLIAGLAHHGITRELAE